MGVTLVDVAMICGFVDKKKVRPNTYLGSCINPMNTIGMSCIEP